MGKLCQKIFDLLKDEKDAKKFIDNTNELLLLINQVEDLKTLYKFVEVADMKLPENMKLKAKWIEKMNLKKEFSAYLFVLLQLVGSIMVAVGFRYQ